MKGVRVMSHQRLTLLAQCISETCVQIKINLKFYFHTSLWFLKRFFEGLLNLNLLSVEYFGNFILQLLNWFIIFKTIRYMSNRLSQCNLKSLLTIFHLVLINIMKPPNSGHPKQRTCFEQRTKQIIPNVTVFFKLPPNSGHLSIRDNFFKNRRCPLFRVFTVYETLSHLHS